MRYTSAFLFALVLVFQSSIVKAEPVHGIAMQGEPALAVDFKHLPYANPDAPKGGTLRLAAFGGYDSLNPLIILGRPAAGLRVYLFESLLARNRSEPFSLYGLIAEKIDVPDDRSRITFFINPKAHFSDGTPITAKDVLFSFDTLREKGRPNHRGYYKKVVRAELDEKANSITFHLDGKDRELVLILGFMPIISEQFFKTHEFKKTTLEPIIGSGPYVIEKVLPGEKIIYKRDENYWGRDLPFNKGLWNFDHVSYTYFRDNAAMFEAFKAGLIDVRYESAPKNWALAYDFDAVKQGKVLRKTIKIGLPKATGAFVFNRRHEIFKDPLVREALIEVFDFEWANKNLFFDLFSRTQGFYTGSELSSIGRPASELEQKLLEKVGAKLDPRFLDGKFHQPVSDGTGRDRKALRRAIKLLAKAGWKFKDRVLTHTKTGKPFTFELMILTSEQEKVALHYQRTLDLIGIKMVIRHLDSAQFSQRLRTYDYDMAPFTWYNSLSPGNEQAFYWGSKGRKDEGTRNYMGVANPAIDKMIDEMVKAPSHEEFVASVRAIDRLLVSGFNIIPLYHAKGQWLAHWSQIHMPKTFSNYGFRAEAAWYEKP